MTPVTLDQIVSAWLQSEFPEFVIVEGVRTINKWAWAPNVTKFWTIRRKNATNRFGIARVYENHVRTWKFGYRRLHPSDPKFFNKLGDYLKADVV